MKIAYGMESFYRKTRRMPPVRRFFAAFTSLVEYQAGILPQWFSDGLHKIETLYNISITDRQANAIYEKIVEEGQESTLSLIEQYIKTSTGSLNANWNIVKSEVAKWGKLLLSDGTKEH